MDQIFDLLFTVALPLFIYFAIRREILERQEEEAKAKRQNWKRK